METHLIDTPCMTIDQFVEYYNSHNFKGQMFDKDGKFNRNYNNYKKTGLIAKIFEDHREDYYLLNKDKVDKYRPNADYEINKVIDCFNQNLGGSVYCCPKCKHKFEAPIEAVLEFEQEDEWNGLPISTPPYAICSKCNNSKCVPIDYKSKRGYHHIYKEEN